MNTSVIDTLTGTQSLYSPKEIRRKFKYPVFIVSTPRSGSTMLFNLLNQSPDFWTIGGESHSILGQFPHLKAENDNLDSGCLKKQHADKDTCEKMRALYLASLVNRDKQSYSNQTEQDRSAPIHFLEKTPRNSLNIEFILQVFPNAKFIFLHRDARQNISSIMEAWSIGSKTGQFVTFNNLPDWPLKHWCLILPPNWRKLKNKGIAEIAAFQWKSCNDIIIKELSKLKKDQWISLSYQDLLESPVKQLQRLCKFSGVRFDEHLQKIAENKIPLSETTITEPHPEKWKRHESDITPLLPQISNTAKKLLKLNQ